MMRILGRLLLPFVMVASSIALGDVATSSASLTPLTYVVDCATQVVKPVQIGINCTTGTRFIKNIHWLSWGGPIAKATGLLTWNLCTPTCTSPHFKSQTIAFEATSLTEVKNKPTYLLLVGPADSWGIPGDSWALRTLQ